jgi:hypothetical protein
MAHEQSLLGFLHRTTHRIPGVPGHVDREPGHQGRARAGQQGGVRHGLRSPAAHHHAAGARWNHSAARPPRVLAGWQARIAAFFGQELR